VDLAYEALSYTWEEGDDESRTESGQETPTGFAASFEHRAELSQVKLLRLEYELQSMQNHGCPTVGRLALNEKITKLRLRLLNAQSQPTSLDYEPFPRIWDGHDPVDEVDVPQQSLQNLPGLGTGPSYSLWIDGIELPIRINLAKAIARLCRSRCEHTCPSDGTLCSRRMWIDAVCVNQEDHNERSQQVWLTSKIFAKAAHCVVWLGEDSAARDGELALNILRWLSEKSAAPSNVLMAFTMATGHAVQSETLSRFFNRRWFPRLWVVQEILFAKDATLMCGGHQLPWRVLQNAT
jgi:hypothetical protein